MIFVQIKGGIGNQLFQYAVGCYASKLNNSEICLDYSGIKVGSLIKQLGIKKSFAFRDVQLECFSIDKHASVSSIVNYVANEIVNRADKGKGCVSGKIARLVSEEGEDCREDHSDMLNLKDGEKNLILSGYWQNMHYIEPIRIELIRQFQLAIPTGKQYFEIRKRIAETNSIGVHVRRGDFVALGWDKGADYYINAMNCIRDMLPYARFYIFSDDPSWAREQIVDSRDCEQVVLEEDHSDVKEFDLLRSCRHQIISESTFGWWAAFLNDNPEKHVCIPFDCRGDIWADDWQRIEYKK